MNQCPHCKSYNTKDLGYIGPNFRAQCQDCLRVTWIPYRDEQIHEVELALRDGLIEELTDTTVTSIELIARLTDVVKRQEASIQLWEQQNKALLELAQVTIDQRDKARAIAVRLEQECHSCMDTVHHGNEEQYESD